MLNNSRRATLAEEREGKGPMRLRAPSRSCPSAAACTIIILVELNPGKRESIGLAVTSGVKNGHHREPFYCKIECLTWRIPRWNMETVKTRAVHAYFQAKAEGEDRGCKALRLLYGIIYFEVSIYLHIYIYFLGNCFPPLMPQFQVGSFLFLMTCCYNSVSGTLGWILVHCAEIVLPSIPY